MASPRTVPIPFPMSSAPGSGPQESDGRLINVVMEPIGDQGGRAKWIRSAGLTQLAATGNDGYRGGLTIKNYAYEVWHNAVAAVDGGGTVLALGSLPGTKPVSIARNNASNPDAIAVDIDNGAYIIAGASFGGTPSIYNGGGVLPQPNSVAFQDGYLFFTVAAGQVYATALNSLSMNALTFITVQSKADVTLLRAIAFSGLLFLFTTGSCEVWQDAANPSPVFPYSRLAVLEFGLVQPSAIAGWETGFSELLWVAQDFGVHWMTAGQLAQVKASPPDLDRLIETAVRVGDTLKAGCYVAAGKKFWVLSSSTWTWEMNLQTKKWSERQSLNGVGYGAWRAVGGHPAFGRWLVGDAQSGNLLEVDDAATTENGTPMLFRIESGPVSGFASQARVARADFDFVVGVGQVVGTLSTVVTGAAASPTGAVRLQVLSTSGMASGDVASVKDVGGTTEAIGAWSITVVDSTHVDLIGTVFVNAWTSGGTVTDLTLPANVQNPVVAISMSRDAGVTWGNPLVRALGEQGNALRTRVTVTNQGLSGPMGVRWRLDITDPVYASLLGGTQSADIRPPGV